MTGEESLTTEELIAAARTSPVTKRVVLVQELARRLEEAEHSKRLAYQKGYYAGSHRADRW